MLLYTIDGLNTNESWQNKMQTPPEEERFQRNAVILGNLVQKCVTDLNKAGYNSINPMTVQFATTMIGGFDKVYLIQGFIDKSHKECWDQIKKRDEDFFVKNAGEIFSMLPAERVNLFRDVFLIRTPEGKSVVPLESKNQMWDLFDALIKISIKYIHRNRQPYSQNVNGELMRAYHASFYDEVDVMYHADNWKVQLEFPVQA
jgi:hypothetical protein